MTEETAQKLIEAIKELTEKLPLQPVVQQPIWIYQQPILPSHYKLVPVWPYNQPYYSGGGYGISGGAASGDLGIGISSVSSGTFING